MFLWILSTSIDTFWQVAFGGIFPSKPINWRDAEGNLPEYWIKHFEELGLSVPEGMPGTNPADMSRSPHVYF